MKTALISVSDKTGLIELGQSLAGKGYRIISTGGTARKLIEAGIAVEKVDTVTGHPEIMDGRVKTLHPKIHGGILGMRDKHGQEATEHGIEWIDLVIVNLYPFAQTVASSAPFEECIEQIDIGGPTMIRSAAKNFQHVTVVCDPSDYDALISSDDIHEDFRKRMALKAFQHTSTYDAMISTWLQESVEESFPKEMSIGMRKVDELRYGENPHQKAAFYTDAFCSGPSFEELIQHQGKKLSFNNLGDLEGALRAVLALEEPGCCVIKHMNPCGAAQHQDGPAKAFTLALSGDPISAYGGIVVFNRIVDMAVVDAIRASKTFFEILSAPGFTADALEALKRRKKMRVLEYPSNWLSDLRTGFDVRRVMGGWLLQEWDQKHVSEWKDVSQRLPTQEERETMHFAWTMCQAVKSNAIVLAKAVEGGYVLNGVGAGQMSRVDAVELAIKKSTRELHGSVLASDAFFPFPDGVEKAMERGIYHFVQPGGSIRDSEVIEAVNQQNGVMITTAARHFRH